MEQPFCRAPPPEDNGGQAVGCSQEEEYSIPRRRRGDRCCYRDRDECRRISDCLRYPLKQASHLRRGDFELCGLVATARGCKGCGGGQSDPDHRLHSCCRCSKRSDPEASSDCKPTARHPLSHSGRCGAARMSSSMGCMACMGSSTVVVRCPGTTGIATPVAGACYNAAAAATTTRRRCLLV